MSSSFSENNEEVHETLDDNKVVDETSLTDETLDDNKEIEEPVLTDEMLEELKKDYNDSLKSNKKKILISFWCIFFVFVISLIAIYFSVY